MLFLVLCFSSSVFFFLKLLNFGKKWIESNIFYSSFDPSGGLQTYLHNSLGQLRPIYTPLDSLKVFQNSSLRNLTYQKREERDTTATAASSKFACPDKKN